MKIERVHIPIFLAIAVLVWWATLFWQNTPVTREHGTPFTVVVSVLGALWFFFDRLLWRLRFLHGWFVKRPDIRGTWRVELQSSYVNPETGKCVPTIVCYMGVKQTLSELKMHLMTPESESWFIASHIQPSPSGNGYQLIGVYTNHPNIHLRNRRISEIHNGTLIINTHGSDVRPNTFKGVYWTDRNTNGTMEFTDHESQVFTRFEDAHQHFKKLGCVR